MPEASVYVSITGLRLRGVWHFPRFMWHAGRSVSQARSAPGNISVRTGVVNGVHHTLSVWRDESSMRAFLYQGAHARAIGAFRSIATGKTFGFETDAPPSWSEVHALWEQRGKEY